MKSMVTEGHLIGNHSYSHSGLFPLYGLSKMKKDLQTCQCELERVTSQPVTLFRPPFGVTNPTIAKAVRQLGYTSIGWSIRTLDTQQSAPDKILARIRKRLKPGAIILLHDRMPGSDQIVKQILDLLKNKDIPLSVRINYWHKIKMYENFITILIAFLLVYRHRPCAEHEKDGAKDRI